MVRIAAATVALALGTTGCAGAVEVTRTFSPRAAAHVSTDALQPVALRRDGERLPLPKGSRVEADRIVLPREGAHIQKLEPGDVLVQNAAGDIVAVRSGRDPSLETRFVPGTASSPPGADYVKGRLAEASREIPLRSSDAIEMHGRLQPGELIPGGGRVESTRSTGWLGAGLVVFALSYAPSLYVGVTSSLPADKLLQVPVAGPWLDFANRPQCVPPQLPVSLPVDPCVGEKVSRGALVTAGALQDLGALFVFVGLPASSKVVVDGDRGVAVLPAPGGAQVVGRF